MTLATEVEFEHDEFEVGTLEQELEVDSKCQTLLQQFYAHLQQQGEPVQHASDLAFSADLYVRDYLLDYCRANVVRPVSGLVRYFAAHWFITHTLDPEFIELQHHLEAIQKFYNFLHVKHYISVNELEIIKSETIEIEYYKRRIESFANITGDGYVIWDSECPSPLKVGA